MGRKSFRLALVLIPAVLCLAAERQTSLKEEMRFGVEAAEHGLWREAIFRWEKFLKDHPDNARLRNNLAVAYESLGQFDPADAQYQEAMRLAPDNKEIRDNYRSFQELYRAVQQRREQQAPAATPQSSATPGPAATPEPVATPGPAATPAPPATPGPAGTPAPAATPGGR